MLESSSSFPLVALLMALILLAILAHGWMARRQVYLRNQLAERRAEYERLGAAVAALAEEVAEGRHGISANTLSVRNLDGELAGLQANIRTFLQEHPELAAEYQDLATATGPEPSRKQE